MMQDHDGIDINNKHQTRSSLITGFSAPQQQNCVRESMEVD